MSKYSSAGQRNKQSKKSESGQHRQIDITHEEFGKIRDALKQEEFRKLFFDYVEEIQDPENRKLYESEITQFEKERGVDVTFIHPKPGFVVKTSVDGELKCFINIASCKEIDPPKHEVTFNQDTGERGLSWSIPMAQNDARDDYDAKKNFCKVYDVIFHPDALHLAKRDGRFRQCLIDTALDAVERNYHVKLDRTNLKFPKLNYKGISQAPVIRKLSKNASAEERGPHPLDDVCPARPDATGGKPNVLPMKTKTTPKPEFTIPKYVIKHSRDIDLAEYTTELDAKLNATVPLKLIVEIDLPLLRTTAECQLDVTDKSIYFLSERPGAKYRLKVNLAYTVNDKEGTARFNSDTRQLIITLPVVRPNSEEERKMHDVLRLSSCEDSGVELCSNSESPVEEEDDEEEAMDSIDHSAIKNGEPVKSADQADDENVSDSNHDDEDDGMDSDDSHSSSPVVPPIVPLEEFFNPSIHYQFPEKFGCNALDNLMAYTLQVRNIQEDSIKIHNGSHFALIQFASLGSGFYPVYYAFCARLPIHADVKMDEADGAINVENWKIESVSTHTTDDNIVMTLIMDKTCDQLQTYFAGPTPDDCKQYEMGGQTEVIPKKNEDDAPRCDLNVTIEQTDDAFTIKISANAMPNGGDSSPSSPTTSSSLSTSTTTTTEEDDDDNDGNDNDNDNDGDDDDNDESKKGNGDQSKSQKKQNRKNRRRNRKSRSHSESSCDEMQQIQQQLVETADEAATLDQSTNIDGIGNKFNSRPLKKLPYTRKQRSFSECPASSAGREPKSILKHHSRYGPSKFISDSCSSIDDCASPAPYSSSVTDVTNSFDEIPEEHECELSESCKKTVRFDDHIVKQVFRLDSSILRQRKKNQKSRVRKQKALQRRYSEGDSAEDAEHEYFRILAHDDKNGDKDTTQATSSSASASPTDSDLNNSASKYGSNKYRGAGDEHDSIKEAQHLNNNAMIFEMDDIA